MTSGQDLACVGLEQTRTVQGQSLACRPHWTQGASLDAKKLDITHQLEGIYCNEMRTDAYAEQRTHVCA